MKIILKVLLLFVSVSINAQTSKLFSLEECIKYAQFNSHEAVKARKNYQSSIESYNSYKSGLLPQLSLNLSAPGLMREISQITQPDGTELFQPQSQLSASGNLSLSQKIPLLGSEFSIYSGISRIDVLESREYSLWRTTPFLLSYRQPIFSFNQMKWNNLTNDLLFEKSDDEYSTAMENIAITITQRFFDYYVAGMNVKNSEQNLQVNDTLYKISQGRYSVGKIAENDLLQNELGLLNAQNDLEIAKLEYKKAGEELALAMGLNNNEKVEVYPTDIFQNIIIDSEKATKEAIENNPFIKDLMLRKIESEMNVVKSESDNSINADLVASFGYNQSATELEHAYKELLDQQRANISIQIPLFNWGKNSSSIEESRLRNESVNADLELQRKTFELDIKYQSQKINQLLRQVVISAKADTIAARRFDVAKNRYLIGKIDLNSYFIAQNEKDSAFRNYIQTLRSFWLSYYTLRKSTLYDFINNKKIVYTLED